MTRRSVVLLIAAALLLAAVIVIFVFVFQGPAGRGQLPDTTGDVVLTVEQALVAEEGQNLNVEGAVVATGGQTVLATTLAGSQPPQASGATLPLKELDLSRLVGLSSTRGEPGMADVTWSDYSLVLEGIIKGGTLTVQRTPPVVEDSSVENVKIRFSPVSEPISSGDQVWWVFDVTNTGQGPLDLVFPDGQRGDVILSHGDVDQYTWSDGKAFAQMVQTVTLQPGEALPIVLTDTLNVPAGTYDLAARVTGLIGPSGAQVLPPDIVTTITIH